MYTVTHTTLLPPPPTSGRVLLCCLSFLLFTFCSLVLDFSTVSTPARQLLVLADLATAAFFAPARLRLLLSLLLLLLLLLPPLCLLRLLSLIRLLLLPAHFHVFCGALRER